MRSICAVSIASLRHSILPGTRRAYARRIQAARRQRIGFLVAEFGVAIENCIAARTRYRKSLPQLLHYPGTARMFRNIEMQDPVPTVRLPKYSPLPDLPGRARMSSKRTCAECGQMLVRLVIDYGSCRWSQGGFRTYNPGPRKGRAGSIPALGANFLTIRRHCGRLIVWSVTRGEDTCLGSTPPSVGPR